MALLLYCYCTYHVNCYTLAEEALDPLYRGAGKSLARTGRKQATATKLKLLRVTQKNSEGCLPNQVSTAVMTSASDEKW